tara:strand:+ start:310 stop:459 length:150 start_codon:yes stop_codon:yes gene_type:complete
MTPIVKLGSWLTIAEFSGEVIKIERSGVKLRGESGEVRSYPLAKVDELF